MGEGKEGWREGKSVYACVRGLGGAEGGNELLLRGRGQRWQGWPWHSMQASAPSTRSTPHLVRGKPALILLTRCRQAALGGGDMALVLRALLLLTRPASAQTTSHPRALHACCPPPSPPCASSYAAVSISRSVSFTCVCARSVAAVVAYVQCVCVAFTSVAPAAPKRFSVFF